VKLLLDEMYPKAIARELRRRGHNVETVAERSDLGTQADVFIFADAQAEQRRILTENVGDFRALAIEHLRQGRHHAGLLFTDNSVLPRGHDRTIGNIVRTLDQILTKEADLTDREVWL
jgi:predicted nuclease of predicted toxin-antitoxin system